MMHTKVQCEAIQAESLSINNVLFDMSIGDTADHVVRNA
jgi:hypothetical protein